MLNKEKLIANPTVVFRDDFDDFAILFNPETGTAFGLNPIGAVIWNLLRDELTLDDLIDHVNDVCYDVSDNVTEQVNEFVEAMISNGLVGTKVV